MCPSRSHHLVIGGECAPVGPRSAPRPCAITPRQVGVRVWHHQFQFAAECVRAELAGVNPKFTATLHAPHLHSRYHAIIMKHLAGIAPERKTSQRPRAARRRQPPKSPLRRRVARHSIRVLTSSIPRARHGGAEFLPECAADESTHAVCLPARARY